MGQCLTQNYNKRAIPEEYGYSEDGDDPLFLQSKPTTPLYACPMDIHGDGLPQYSTFRNSEELVIEVVSAPTTTTTCVQYDDADEFIFGEMDGIAADTP